MRASTLTASIFMSICLLAAANSAAWANAIVVTNVERLAAPNRHRVAFRIGWQNSWNVTGIPGNHDAAWVFIKFRACGTTGEWQHARLSTNMPDHTLDPSLAFAEPITVNDRFGNPGNHNTGAMIRRASNGTGHLVSLPCTLDVSGSSSGVPFDPSTEYDVRVIGIEMVMIPQGDYLLGDNGSTNYKFQISGANTNPQLITGEGAQNVYCTACGNNRALAAGFPKGWGKFYVMKYEISQGQYVDFLNTITVAQSSTRFPSFNGSNRFSMYVSGGEYVTDRRDRACNYLSYDDVLSYLDWAALRPMTEMEYEKASKGAGLHAPGGYAWGSTTLVECLNISGTENGTETCTNLNANMHYSGSNWNVVGGDAGQGPVGCGIFARDATQTRETTGATYYGVMEMSGNVWETVITLFGSTGCGNNPTYTGIWGNGMLSAGGTFDLADWPAAVNANPRPNGLRGGSFADDQSYARTSDRYYAYWGGNTSFTRSYNVGGRGCR
jgi:formylglycine-generating enzyme required for sulfatase activity